MNWQTKINNLTKAQELIDEAAALVDEAGEGWTAALKISDVLAMVNYSANDSIESLKADIEDEGLAEQYSDRQFGLDKEP